MASTASRSFLRSKYLLALVVTRLRSASADGSSVAPAGAAAGVSVLALSVLAGAAGAVVAVSAFGDSDFAGSILAASAFGASAGFAASAAFAGSTLAASGVTSAAVGGGTFEVSGVGTAALMEESTGFAGSACAKVTVPVSRKVAATAASTRSKPLRPVEKSCIIEFPERGCFGLKQRRLSHSSPCGEHFPGAARPGDSLHHLHSVHAPVQCA